MPSAPRKGAAAARAERNGNGHRDLDFHGVTLTLPAKLPNSFAMRFARIASREEKGENAAGDIYDLVVTRPLGPNDVFVFSTSAQRIDGAAAAAAPVDPYVVPKTFQTPTVLLPSPGPYSSSVVHIIFCRLAFAVFYHEGIECSRERDFDPSAVIVGSKLRHSPKE